MNSYAMKNIWKDRWDNCTKCMGKETLTRTSDKISSLVHYTLRKNLKTNVQKLSGGYYILRSEATQTDNPQEGTVIKAFIHTYEIKDKKYIILLREAIFFPHPEDHSKDYYILKEWDKGIAQDSSPIFEMILKKLENATK